MQTIYNAQGEAKECEAVDAREHIESGRWFNEAPVVEKAKEEKESDSSMTKKQIQAKLTELGVAFDEQTNKSGLKELLDASGWKPE
jgi:hypothetical protein